MRFGSPDVGSAQRMLLSGTSALVALIIMGVAVTACFKNHTQLKILYMHESTIAFMHTSINLL